MKIHAFFLFLLLCGFGVFFLPAAALAQGNPEWNITTPYQGNPLTLATLAGTAQFNNTTGQAWLIVACRPGAGKPEVTLRIDKTLAESFPVDKYEGPGGLGEKMRALRVAMDKGENADTYLAGGARQENGAFQWTFSLPQPGMERWISAPGTMVTVYIRQAGQMDPRLEATFTLPDSNLDLLDVVTPCWDK